MRGLFTLAIYSLFLSALHAQQFRFEHYSVSDGLPSARVFGISQDEKGAVWIGTELGLSRFNGKNFEGYGVINGLPGNSVFEVWPEHNRLWLTTYSGIGYWSEGKYTRVKPENSENSDKLLSLLEAQGKIYLSARDRLYVFEDEELQSIALKPEGRKFGTGKLQLIDSVGNIWISSPRAAWLIQDDMLERVYHDDRWAVKHFILEDPQKRIFYVSSNNLGLLSEDGLEPIYPELTRMITEELDPSVVYIDPEGNWWVGTFEKGLYLFRASDLESGQFVRYMDRETVSAIFQDRDGNLWIGSMGGGLFLLSYRARQVRNFNRLDYPQLAQRFEKSAVSADGTHWHFDKNLIASRGSDTVVINRFGNIYRIVPLQDGSVYLPSSSGMYQWDWNSALKYREENKGLSGKQKNQYAQKEHRIVTERTRVVWVDSILNHTWIYAESGILRRRYENDKLIVDTIARNRDDFHYIVSGITGFPGKDRVWISSYGRGLLLWDNNKLSFFDTEFGLNSNNLIDVHVDEEDAVWVFGSKGVNKLEDFDYYSYNCRTLSLYENDGLMMGEVRAGFVENDTVWLNTNAGVTQFPADLMDREPRTNPGIEITGVVVSGSDTTVRAQYELSYRQNDLELKFAGIAFSDSRKIRYRYRVQGLTEDWLETDFEEVRLPSLRPGIYTFEVKAIDIYGKESERPELIQFTIVPAIWQRLDFKIATFIAAGLLLSFSLWSYFRFMNKHREEQLIIQTQIAETEQKALRAQMNPHFVYNVLNSIQQFILRSDTISALDYLSDFGDLIRRSFENSKHLTIPLQDEIEFLKLYLELENMRVDGKINWHINVGQGIDTEQVFVPSLLIQPFVENSIRHGLKHRHGEGIIDIEFLRENGSLVCTIVDDGIGIGKAAEYENWKPEEYRSSGMAITRNRLELYNRVSSRSVGMEVSDRSSTGENGTRVVLTIPLLGRDEKPAIHGQHYTDTLSHRGRRAQEPGIS